MSGYTEIIKTLKEIRRFLQGKLTPQLMNSLQGAANAIQGFLGDPALGANLREALTQINSLLQDVNKADIVNQLPQLMQSLQSATNVIQGLLGDPALQANLRESLTQINTLLQTVNTSSIVNQLPQLMQSLQAAASVIQGLLGDQVLQANLRGMLSQINSLLQGVNEADIVNQLPGIIGELGAFIKDNREALGDTINSLNRLLQDAQNAGIIQNIMKALDSVNSFRDLVEIAKELTLPTKVCLYGTAGAFIGLGLTEVMKTYFGSKKDSQLQASIDKLIDVNMALLVTQINALRFESGEFKLDAIVARHQNLGLVLPDDLRRLEDEATRNLAVLSPIDSDSLECLVKAQEFGRKMLKSLADLDNESMSDYLDRINDNLQSWSQLVEAVVFAPTAFNSVKRPILPRGDFNYLQIKRLYGDKQIDAMMQGLVIAFRKNGGDDLFYAVANNSEDSSYLLSECIKQIPEEKLVPDDAPWTESIRRLHENYHEQANQQITQQWDSINWAHLPGGKPILEECAPAIIRNRALAEFCHQTAPYLCFPRNIHREIYNGIIDLPIGMIQFARHPVNSLSNLGQTLFTMDGLKSLGRNIAAHPVRRFTSQAVSAVVGMGVAARVAQGASMFSHATAVHGRSLLQMPTPPSAASTLIKAAEKGGAVGSLPVMFSKTENKREPEIAMKRPDEPSVPKISQENFATLIERIQKESTHTDFYTIISQWYKEINAANINAETVSSAIERGFFATNANVRQRAPQISPATIERGAQLL